jgi:6,7-dimethyl-8-ribityllumazine synthase
MKKILIVQSVYYEKISELLLKGATAEIQRSGFGFDIINVAGSLEIAAAISIYKEKKNKIFSKFDEYYGYVALGCVIKGETSHYDIVCAESARALTDLSINAKIAIGNGILTVENEAQALERADPAKKDRGGFASFACIEMIKIREKILFNRKI